jgi:hypothetical protein
MLHGYNWGLPIIKRIIETGLAENTKPKDRPVIFMKLSELLNILIKGMSIESDIESEACDFLKHYPQLV